MKKSVILMGIKHCGKSTQGRFLSQHFGCPLYDTDDVVKELTGMGPREIYNKFGKEEFVKKEAEACAHVADKIRNSKKMAVIATGGGICDNSKALECLHQIGTFVFLNAAEKDATERVLREVTVAQDGTLGNMPAYIAKKNPSNLEQVRDIFHQFYVERQQVYGKLADITVNLNGGTKQENTKHILDLLSSCSE